MRTDYIKRILRLPICTIFFSLISSVFMQWFLFLICRCIVFSLPYLLFLFQTFRNSRYTEICIRWIFHNLHRMDSFFFSFFFASSLGSWFCEPNNSIRFVSFLVTGDTEKNNCVFGTRGWAFLFWTSLLKVQFFLCFHQFLFTVPIVLFNFFC